MLGHSLLSPSKFWYILRVTLQCTPLEFPTIPQGPSKTTHLEGPKLIHTLRDIPFLPLMAHLRRHLISFLLEGARLRCHVSAREGRILDRKLSRALLHQGLAHARIGAGAQHLAAGEAVVAYKCRPLRPCRPRKNEPMLAQERGLPVVSSNAWGFLGQRAGKNGA